MAFLDSNRRGKIEVKLKRVSDPLIRFEKTLEFVKGESVGHPRDIVADYPLPAEEFHFFNVFAGE